VSWSLADFKATSLEVGQWCWGTLQGSFNEKQTISQVIVDAVIGMIPLVGDLTAVRDLLSVTIGMSTDPKKRQEVMQWVMIVILVFALIPVAGGVIKGVGRLALRITGDVAKDSKLLVEVIEFLNRVGHGNAQKWLKALDVMKYQAEILSKFKNFCTTVSKAIRESLNARVGKILPEVWRTAIERVGSGIEALKDLADRMIPQGLKELDAKLKVLQRMVYHGELHEIATGGMPKVEREAEAYLEERKLAREFRRGKYPVTECLAEGPMEAEIEALYRAKIEDGWPDILKWKGKIPQVDGQVFTTLATFHGEVTALEAQQLEGKTIYRAFGNETARATKAGGTAAGGKYQPAFWGVGTPPKSAHEWRLNSAVLDEWNGNGFLVVAHIPPGFAETMPNAKAWYGQIAEQFGVEFPDQYLVGGAPQLVVDMGDLAKKISEIGEQIKKDGKAVQTEYMGVRLDFLPTHWTDVEGVYGYSHEAGHLDGAAQTRKLASVEVQTKMVASKAAVPAPAKATEEEPH
jgi:hypothetical protein